MNRNVLRAAFAGALAFWPDVSRCDEAGREIGYVESYSDRPDQYVIHRADQDLPVAVMAPIRSGDRIEVKNSTATIALRLLNRSTPVVISKSNLDTLLSDSPPKRPFWTPLVSWASKQINIFDRGEREQVSASIRAGSTGFSAPLFKSAQVLPAGEQSIAIGWLGQGQVTVRLYDSARRTMAAGSGTGGLWFSPRLNLVPGTYALTLSNGSLEVRQSISVLPSDQFPSAPTEVTLVDLPQQLSEVVVGAWLSAKDRQFSLAGLQHVAPIASRSMPARLLERALVRGDRPDPPP